MANSPAQDPGATGVPGDTPTAQGAQQSTEARASRRTAIAQRSTIEGDFKSRGDIVIDGDAKGTVQCTGRFESTPTSDVEAKVTAGSVVIAGRFNGEVDCQGLLTLVAGSRVTGTLRAGQIAIEEGAHLEAVNVESGGASSGRPKP